MHNGFVNIDNEKMSKSLNNFFTIREVLKVFHPETLRLFLLSTHYRSPINYSDSNLAESRKRLDYLYETIRKINTRLGTNWSDVEGTATGDFDRLDTEHDNSLRERFQIAMDDDFNTPKGLGDLSFLFTKLNQVADGQTDHSEEDANALLADGLRYIKEFGNVLGLWQADPADYLATPQGTQATGDNAGGLTPEEIEGLLVKRTEARKNKDFATSDQIRDQLAEAGIEIKDSPEGTTWKYSS
jgi:cysteinyl-tRNA synthetase